MKDVTISERLSWDSYGDLVGEFQEMVYIEQRGHFCQSELG